MPLTSRGGLRPKITLMGKARGDRSPTKMGNRILELMQVYRITNQAQFAEGVLGISRQSFHAWLYKPMNPERIAARPLLVCAEALGTNPEYLLCMTDDPRPETALSIDEAHLVQAFRALTDVDRGRLLKNAADWLSHSPEPASTAAPFRAAIPTEKNR